MLPRKSGRTPGPNSGRQVGVLAIAAVAGILMTSNQVPANATIGQAQTPGSISQPHPDGHSSRRPDPSRDQHRGREMRPSDRWRGKPQRYQDRPHGRDRDRDRYRGRRGENAAPAGRERLSREERMMRELQDDPSFPEIIVREK
ncbi:hypothetical protein ABT352_03380 [Streptosporangium sp. NPDC000563]|uniref:hypothetical protein n=1 Tax=unclassified Streptosporangium TaxID=2632669 RepID=UPI00331D8A9D